MSADDAGPPLFRYRFGTAEFDEARFELRVSDAVIDVQRKPLEILSYLLAHAGEVVTKDELLATVWEGRPTVENVLANAIAKLRSALGPENAERIVTQPRIGYRFTGPLERIAVGRSLVSSLDLTTGAAVPGRQHFLLETLIGRSRDSEVWTARHSKTGELRVYKLTASGERLSALKREATLFRVLRASLGDRPDFARVIDWNFETPPFFLECEYGGRNLGEWAEEDGRLASMPLSERLELFLRIAEAVAAAHSVGVLHKDLKPTNVLVSPRPVEGWQVQLTDFGSGRLLEANRLAEMGITRLGLTLTQTVLSDSSSGTPLYLAPEVLAGQMPTVQSDLFALGIMLYQLTVADFRKPMVPGWEREVPDELLREDIAAATDGDRTRRLATVAELVERLRKLESRRLERERAAAAEQAARRASEALQRSRARRPWIAAVMVVLTLGLGVSLWLYRNAEIASARIDAINDFLNWDVLANTGALKTDADPDPTMLRVLKNASVSVGQRFADDPASEGQIRLAIGQGLGGLGDYAAAEEQHRLAVELLKQAYGPTHDKTLNALYTYAGSLLERSKFLEAEAVLSELDLLGPRLLSTSVIAMKGHALRGMLRATRKNCGPALRDFEAAQQFDLGTSAEAAYNRYNIRSWIGQSLNCLGRYAEARDIYEGLLGPEHDAAEIGPALMAYARLGYAEALRHTERIAEAEAQFLRALRQIESEIGDVDALTMGQALVQVGNFYLDLGRFDAARQYLTRGRDLLLTVGEQQEKGLDALRGLAIIDYSMGELQRSVDGLHVARAGFVAVFGESSPDVQGTTYWLAAALTDVGRIEEAAQLSEQLQPDALRTSLGGRGWAARLDALRAKIMIRQGRLEEGQALLASALSQLERSGVSGWMLESLIREGLPGNE
ncbi:MAG TPA: winged helix-turn-helix domain-containing protein [Steroidobacteraceae bacterium]